MKFGSCFGAASRLPVVDDYQIMRILFYGTSTSENGDTVSAVISLLDTAGNECAVLERSWRGSSLSIDFRSAEFSGRKFLFPEIIYGCETIYEHRGWGLFESGTYLERYYNENGQCMLLGTGSSYKDRHDLYRLSRFAANPIAVFSTGFSRRYRVDLSRCEKGVYYAVVTDFNGRLELRPE
ncbi:MAG: hypothetical protein M0P01_05085 [Treponema sp.]|nr:hypothetical protein [Treponema sp.]